jgi:hypothetical protein
VNALWNDAETRLSPPPRYGFRMPKSALAATSRFRSGGTGDVSDSGPDRPTPSPAAVFALLVALLSGALVAFGPAAPAAAGEPETIHSLVNEARAGNGLAPLQRNAGLDAVASAWAAEMARTGTLQHNPNVGTQIPAGWTGWGENIAMGHKSGAAMQQGWIDSPDHYDNIMGDFSDIGIAFLRSGGSTWGVQVFANYSAGAGKGPAALPAAPAPRAKSADDSADAERAQADERAAAERAERKAADAAAASAETEERKAAEQKAAEQKAAKHAEQKRQAKQDQERSHTEADIPAGSAPSASASPAGPRADAPGTDAPQAASHTTGLAPAVNQGALIGMGLVLLVALVLLSPTLRRTLLPRRGPRQR